MIPVFFVLNLKKKRKLFINVGRYVIISPRGQQDT